MKAEGKTVIPGEDAAFLYQSGGFPVDLTRIMAEDAGMTVDEAGKYKSEWRARASRMEKANCK